MKSRNTFKKGSCEMLVLHILSKKGDCYGYEIGQIIRDITNEYLSFPEGSMYPVLYKLIDSGYITDYKKQVGRRMIRVYYHIESSSKSGNSATATATAIQYLRGHEVQRKTLSTTLSCSSNGTLY